MRFEEAYRGWPARRLTQEEAARLLGVCERAFRCYIDREAGLEGLIDKRLEQVSHRRAPVDEVLALTERYCRRHGGWNVKHFDSGYRRDGGARSYTWGKSRLQEAGRVAKAPGKGTPRKRRERAPLPGRMVHQDASRHEWVAGQLWDLVVTMDDATNEHYSMCFVEEEGSAFVAFLGGALDDILCEQFERILRYRRGATASALRGGCCNSRPTGTAATMSRRRCGSIRMEAWASFTARANWPTYEVNGQLKGPDRKAIASVRHAAFCRARRFGLRPRALPSANP
jgi:hypothetical protein